MAVTKKAQEAAAAKTTKEAVRLPLEDRLAKETEGLARPGFVFDHENEDYVTVEDKIPGVRMNQRDIAFYRRIGFKVASTDPEVTGHEAITLMARPKAIGDAQRAKDSKRNNGGYKRGGEFATRSELREGIVQVEDNKPLRAKDMGASLPDESEIARRNREIEERVAGVQDDPRLIEAAMQNLDDFN